MEWYPHAAVRLLARMRASRETGLASDGRAEMKT